MSTFVFTNHHGQPHRDTAEHRGLRLVIAEADHPSAAIEERHAVRILERTLGVDALWVD